MYSVYSVGKTPLVDPASYRSFLTELAVASGEFIKPFFGNPELQVETKSDATPVTKADRGAEEVLRRLINARYPHHGIIGEEHGSENEKAEFVWILDPIDGTKSFITGVPLWGTLIALLHNGQPVLGCIHQPILGQLMIGDGKTTTLNDRAVRVRDTKSIEEATVLTTSTINLRRLLGPTSIDLLNRAKLVRTWGDCYGYLLVASGQADAMVDAIMNPWDIAALVPIVRGAGGTITDLAGGSPFPAESTVAAGTAELHAEMLAGLKA